MKAQANQEKEKEAGVCAIVSLCVLAVHVCMNESVFESEQSLHVTTCVPNTFVHDFVCQCVLK